MYKIKVGSKQSRFLGIVVEDVKDGIFAHNLSAVQQLICHFAMDDCKHCNLPLPAGFGSLLHTGPPHTDFKSYQKHISCLMYQSNRTRPDIAYVTNYLGQFVQKLPRDHWTGAKHVLRYLRGTQQLGTYYNRDGYEAFEGYADSNWVQEKPDRKSVTGLLFPLGGGAIVWKSKQTEHRSSEFTRDGIYCDIICYKKSSSATQIVAAASTGPRRYTNTRG